MKARITPQEPPLLGVIGAGGAPMDLCACRAAWFPAAPPSLRPRPHVRVLA